MANIEKIMKVSKDDIHKILERKYNVEIITLTMSSKGVKCILK